MISPISIPDATSQPEQDVVRDRDPLELGIFYDRFPEFVREFKTENYVWMNFQSVCLATITVLSFKVVCGRRALIAEPTWNVG